MATTAKKTTAKKTVAKKEEVAAKPSLAELIKADPNTGVQVMGNRLRNYAATYATLSDVTELSNGTFEFVLANHRFSCTLNFLEALAVEEAPAEEAPADEAEATEAA